jgi:hypothetical protein
MPGSLFVDWTQTCLSPYSVHGAIGLHSPVLACVSLACVSLACVGIIIWITLAARLLLYPRDRHDARLSIG